jgi:hypothetical protein
MAVESLTYLPNDIRTPEGKWLKSDVFRQEAIRFRKNGVYCTELPRTPKWREYWDEQLRRCQEGFEVAGHKITQHHYHYLNFTEIKIVIGEEDDPNAIKDIRPPDFWDGDYDYFWSLEIARNGTHTSRALLTSPAEKEEYRKMTPEQQREARIAAVDKLLMKVIPHPDWLEGGHHMIVGKARRKGYSFKNGAICANLYNTIRESQVIIGASDKKYLYPKGTMQMASDYLSYFNEHTAFTKGREYVDKVDHKKASFKKVVNGAPVESGYKSEIFALTFKDNPDVARGKDPLLVLLEEAGAFPNLKPSYNAIKPSLGAGKYITGQIIIFGTGGDMESGTVHFADMFYNPMEHNLMPFLNIWDENANGTYCGFFHPMYMNHEGFYDDQGNSDVEAAKAWETEQREKIKAVATSSVTLNSRMQEFPFCPAEAFLLVSSNGFPVFELRRRLNIIKREKLHLKLGQPVHLTKDGEPVREEVKDEADNVIGHRFKSRVKAIPDLDGVLQPIWNVKVAKNQDLNGAVVIYEYPVAGAPKGLYKIGFDPYRQDDSGSEQPSLGVIYVYKSVHKHSQRRNEIVAQYVGRPETADDVNRIAMLLAELYNAEIMFENEVTHVKSYFIRKKKAHLMAAQPDAVISKNVKQSTVARVFGCHMNDQLKDAGEKYIKEWLLGERDFDENGDAVLNLDTLNDPGLIEELINYNRKGNFDRVMALMMVMMQLQEEEEGKVHEEKLVNPQWQRLQELRKKQFARNTNY